MMYFKTGEKVLVKDRRKGIFKGIVAYDFDTDKDEWYQITLDQPSLLGMVNEWIEGEHVPCRKGISFVEHRSDDE